MFLFDQVTIMGPGLLGASLGMAFRSHRLVGKIVVWARKKETLLQCEGKDWCDRTAYDLEKALDGSNLIVICTPVESILSLLPKIIRLTNKNVIITDVGSVKGIICKTAEIYADIESGRFIGSHPMAGSEKSGMKYADADLFQGKTCIVTPLPNSEKEKIAALVEFWEKIGMKVFMESYSKHDEIVAYISHLPHVLASSLGAFLSDFPMDWKKMSGQGLKDTTRIAEGDSELWCQIIKMNQSSLNESLGLWINTIQDFKRHLENGNWEMVKEFLEKGTNFRKEL